MTLLGKIFTVLIFIMSLVFMAFAVAVYATHRNWKDMVMRPATEVKSGEQLGLKHQLEDAKKLYDQLIEEKGKVENQLAMEKASRRQALAALEARTGQLTDQLAALDQRNQALILTEREALARLESTQRNLVAIQDEVADLRGRVRTVQLDRDTQFQQVVALTDTMHQSRAVRANLEERNKQMAEEVARRRELMDLKGISVDEPLDKTPPKVDGVVTAVSKSGFVEISLGSDDGIRDGHQLEVFNDKSFLGRIKIRKVSPNRAVGEIIKEFQKGPVEKGNRVATRLTSS